MLVYRMVQQLKLRLLQRCCLGYRRIAKLLVELSHQLRGGLVADRPEGRECAPGSGLNRNTRQPPAPPGRLLRLYRRHPIRSTDMGQGYGTL